MSRLAIKTTEVFSFAELSPEGQAKAIEVYSESESENWDGEHITNDFKEKLKELGFEDIDIRCSGFYSQGDGASFTSSNFDIRKVMKAIGIAARYKSFYSIVKTQDIQGQVSRISIHYCHENTVEVVFPEYYGNNEQEGDVAAALTEYIRTLCKELYRLFELDYDYACSGKNAREYLNIGDTEYTANGKIY